MFSNQRLLIIATTVLFCPTAMAADTVKVGTDEKGHPIVVQKAPDRGPQKLKLPFGDNSLWFRYYQAGEDASITRHDNDLAKKYWLASLAELEKHPVAKGSDTFLSVKLSALEAGLMKLYPEDWSKEKGDTAATLAKRKENVELLQRMATINTYYAPKDDLFRIKANERYAIAKQSYDKAVAEAKRSPSAPKTETE